MLRIIFILATTILLAGCASTEYYKVPPTIEKNTLATIQGFASPRTGFLGFNWLNGSILFIDNKSVSYPFLRITTVNYQIPITPSQHVLTVQSTLSQGGNYFDAIGDITATFKPGEHYKLNGRVKGARINLWIEDKVGNPVSPVIALPYHASPQDVPVVIPIVTR